jgi:hypothetical protein
VQIPTPITGPLTLTAIDPSLIRAPTAHPVTTGGVADVLCPVAPAALLALTSAALTGFTVSFTPAGDEPTETIMTLSLADDTWALIPQLNLAISELSMSITVRRAPGYASAPQISGGVSVQGTLSLGGGQYQVTAGLPPSGAWFIQISDTGNQPTLAVLAGLCGLTEGQVTGALPESLLALGQDFSLSQVWLRADPTTQALSEVDFTIAQTSPWPLVAGLLTVSGWTIGMSITGGADGWATTGTLTGDVTVGSGDSAVTLTLNLPVPISEDALWTLRLADDQTAHLPTIGEVLDLLGGTPAALPAGISSLGGLDVDQFGVSVNPAATTLVHLDFGFDTTSPWVIIPGELEVTSLSAAFSFDPGTVPASTRPESSAARRCYADPGRRDRDRPARRRAGRIRVFLRGLGARSRVLGPRCLARPGRLGGRLAWHPAAG